MLDQNEVCLVLLRDTRKQPPPSDQALLELTAVITSIILNLSNHYCNTINNFTVEQLETNHVYYIEIYFINTVGTSKIYCSEYIKIPNIIPSWSKNNIFTVSHLSHDFITLTWNTVDCHGYDLILYEKEHNWVLNLSEKQFIEADTNITKIIVFLVSDTS